MVASCIFVATLAFAACNNGQPKNTQGNQGKPKPTEKPAKKLTINFEETAIECKKKGESATIKSGAEVSTGAEYIFTAKGMNDADVSNWVAKNSVQKDSSGKANFEYKVNAGDADSENKINIKFNKTTDMKFEFDSAKITCKKGVGTSLTENPENKAENGVQYTFTAQLGSGEQVRDWYVNKARQTTFSSSINIQYTANAQDADANNKILVQFAKRGKITLKFDPSKITCVKSSPHSTDVAVNTGEKFENTMQYTFTANLTSGNIIEYWAVNGKKDVNETDARFSYRADERDADADNIIEISFKEKQPEVLKIIFDNNKVYCCEYESERDVDSGSSVTEGVEFTFIAKLGEGKVVDHWKINERDMNRHTEYYFFYTPKSSDANENKEISISFVERVAETAQLSFSPAEKIECKLYNKQTQLEEDIPNNSTIAEGKVYYFYIKNYSETEDGGKAFYAIPNGPGKTRLQQIKQDGVVLKKWIYRPDRRYKNSGKFVITLE